MAQSMFEHVRCKTWISCLLFVAMKRWPFFLSKVVFLLNSLTRAFMLVYLLRRRKVQRWRSALDTRGSKVNRKHKKEWKRFISAVCVFSGKCAATQQTQNRSVLVLWIHTNTQETVHGTCRNTRNIQSFKPHCVFQAILTIKYIEMLLKIKLSDFL